MALSKTIAAFYQQLEDLTQEHEELSDTDVREALHETINYYFVWGKPRTRTPLNYGLFSKEGDAAVASAVARFVANACAAADAERVPLGQARLDRLQDDSIETRDGSTYDCFIGQSDEPLPPDELDPRRFAPRSYS